MKGKTYILTGLIALFLLFGLITPQAAEARDIIIDAITTLDFDPTPETATTCASVDVNVVVNDAVNLTGYHLEVTYEPDLIEITNVVNGGLLVDSAERPGLYEPTNWEPGDPNSGTILFGMAQRGVDGNPTPVTGSGNLITISLKAKVPTGTAELAIGAESMLVDWPDAFAIPFSIIGPATINLSSCAPTDVALSKTTVAENMPVPAFVGNLSATDPDPADVTFTYSLVDTASYPNNAAFAVAGGVLNTAEVFNYETKNSYQIKVRATDPHGAYWEEVFTISVTDVNDAPVLAAIGAKNFSNAGTLAFTASATDEDVPAQTLTYSITNAPVGATINSATGAFSWTPTVATAPGTYYATVCVSDSLLEDCETITITVTDGEAPTIVSGVAHGVAPYGDVTAGGLTFAVPQGYVVSTIDFTMSEPVKVVGSNIVYLGTVPYGTMTVVDDVVTVTPYAGNEIATLLGTFTFNIDAGAIEDLVGNPLTTLNATLIVTDQTAPVMEAVTPAEGLVTLGLDDTFILTVDALDLNLYELEIDHSFEETLPEFSVYASEETPWGTQADKDMFDAAGVAVSYDADLQKWTINFGVAITDNYFIPNGVTFYMVLYDQAHNQWGSMFEPELGDENTYAYTFEVTNTLEPEITSSVTYVYSPVYNYVGDIVFDDPNNIFTATYSPAEFLAGGAMNDLARYLGALYWQDTSTIITIVYDGDTYTWNPAEPNTGSNWYNGTTSLVSAMVADYLAAPGELVITVGDGWHTADVTFRLLITNTLDDEIESAPSYMYDPVYTYVGISVFNDATNLYTVTYDDVDFNPNAMYDLARYLGALHRQTGATVTSIVYDGVTYTWSPTGTLHGSNWVDSEGNTLVSAVVAGIGSYDPAVGLVFTVSDGVHTEEVTFKFVITDTTAPVVTITGATADDMAMDGNLEDGYILPTTNDPDINHSLQIVATANEPLQDTYFGLHLTGASPEQIAALEAYYAMKSEPYQTYLLGALDGTNPFVYIDGGSLTLVDAAQHDLPPNHDVPMVVPDDFPLGAYTVQGVVKDAAGNETIVTLTLIVTGDRVAPTVVSGVAIGAETLDNVPMIGTTFTVPQGYEVDHIEITLSEAVQIVAPGVVYFEGNPYGTMTASGSVVTITPYAGNETAGIPGTFDFTIDAGSITDLAGNALATLAATMVVEPSPIFNITDFGAYVGWDGAYSLGWGYVPLFDTTTIASIEVGMLDAARESIVTYTAAGEQLVYQSGYGYINAEKLSSAPFYRVYDGNPIVEGPDLDWTVIFGEAFDAWSPRWGYVRVTDIYGTVVYHEIEYTGSLGDLTAPLVEAAVAIGADPFADVTAVGLIFTVPLGYTVETIEFTMSEPVTVVTGTEVTLAGVPYGLVTVSADGMTLIVTPYPGNTVANLTGTFVFDVPEGKIFDLSGNPLGTLSATMIVMPALEVTDADLLYSVTPEGTYTALDGSFTDGFVMELDPAVEYYYLDTNTITASNELEDGLYPFYLGTTPAGFFDYWAAKGVVAGATEPWQIKMWEIINGDAPMFYIKVVGTEYTLIDGLAGEPNRLKINGTYLPGEYTFSGSLTDIYGSSDPMALQVTFVNALAITDADLFYGTDPLVIDQPLGGDFETGFTMVLDPMVPWYYLDTEMITSNNELADGRYTFYESSDPSQPVFYLDVSGDDFALIDAYKWLVDGVVSPLRNNGDFTPGTYTYTGTLTDIYGSTSPVSITITFNDVPYATAQSVTVVEDTPTAITLSGLDLFPGTMTYAVVTPPTHGTLSGTPPALTYTPDADFHGTDSFTFTLSDGTLTSTAATVSITVTSVLDAPTVDSTNLPGPYYVGQDQAFEVTLTNPANGDAFTNVLARFRLGNITLADIASFQYLETSVDPDVWLPLPLAQDGTGVIGDFGPATGFPMGVPYSATSQFKVTFTKAGTYPASIVLYDVAAEPDMALDTYTANVVVIDLSAPIVSIISAEADGSPMDGTLEDGYILPTTNDPLIDHLLQIDASVNEPLAAKYNGLYFVEGESTVTAAQLKAYYDARGVPAPYLDFLKGAADGINPFVFLKEDNLTLTLVDAAKYTYQGADVDMTVPDTFPLGKYVVRGVIEDEEGNETTVTLILIVTGDRVAPEIDSGVAIGATGFDPVTAGADLLFTVPQGYEVDHIEITMSEAVQIVAPGIVYLEGIPYGTMSASGSVVTVTPYAGNEVANIPGTFDFTIDGGSIKDLAGNALITLTATMVVEPSTIFDMTDFGPWGDTWPGAYNVGWQYVPLFDTTTIASIEVGMLDSARASIVTYTADAEQIAWQGENGYITPEKLSSAPFYRVYNGNPIVEGRDLDWTVGFGTAFESWSPRWGYVEVTDIYGTVVYHELEYTGPLGDLTAPMVGSATAIGVDPYGDIAADNLTFTVPQGYTVDHIEFTMSEPVTVVAGTEVTLAGVPYGTITASGTLITVTPYPGNEIANLLGTFIFEVPAGKIFDLSGNPLGTLSATMVVINVAPVAVDDAYTVAEDGVLTVAARGVLINDTDFDPAILTAVLVTGPANGTVVLNADGSFTYTPVANFNGTDTFTYKANDGLADSNVATVTITVTAMNDAPVAQNQSVDTPEDTALPITLVATDVDGDTLTYAIVAQPAHGTVTLVSGVATYTPALNYVGEDSFTFKANDGTADSNIATVTINVTPLNDTPVAVDDIYTMDEDTILTVAAPGVMENDSDVDLDAMEVVLVTDVLHGDLSLMGNGSFVYVPDPDFNGTDTFVYKLVTYPALQSQWTDEATVTITVRPIGDAPVLGLIQDATIPELVAFSFTATATDVDLPAQVLAFSLVGAPEGAAITTAGIFTWTPTEAQGAGVYTFTVKVCDDTTPTPLCDEQDVTLTVTEVNVAPVVQDKSATTPEETPVDVILVATDADNDTLTYAIVDQPAHGTVTLVGTTATYTPELDYTGPDSFTYKANDGLVDSNVATVSITVTPVNDAPVAVDDAYTMAEKATLNIAAPGVLANDTDVDGDTLTTILVDTVSNGVLTLNADGSFTYTPNEYFNGTDSFTYKAKDAVLESELAVVTITVTPVNDWPIANDDSYEVLTGTELVKDSVEGILANDVLLDPDEEVSIEILDEPQHGTLVMQDDGSFTYIPDAGYMGTDTFRYMLLSVRVNAEWSDDALVTIVVKPYMGIFLPLIWR